MAGQFSILKTAGARSYFNEKKEEKMLQLQFSCLMEQEKAHHKINYILHLIVFSNK